MCDVVVLGEHGANRVDVLRHEAPKGAHVGQHGVFAVRTLNVDAETRIEYIWRCAVEPMYL